MEKEKKFCYCGEKECQPTVRARLIANDEPKQWHNLTHDYFVRLVEYLHRPSKSDIMIQVQKTYTIWPKV